MIKWKEGKVEKRKDVGRDEWRKGRVKKGRDGERQ